MPAPAIATAIGVVFLLLLLLELRFPLRRAVESKARRVGRNLVVAATAGVLSELLRIPLLVPVVEWTKTRNFGLLGLIALPEAAKVVLAVVLLDYTLWWWHWLSHRVPLLWRFHLVHHADRDLDASTALRFHFGEHALSVFFRMAQVVVIGAPPVALALFQAVLFVSVFFHHSNLRLPLGLERRLVWFVVTPRMHGIHHSDFREEANSNWSSLLSVWDRLHGTLLLGVSQREVVIGVPAFEDPRSVTLGRILALPFRRRGPDWAGRIGPRVPRGGLLAD